MYQTIDQYIEKTQQNKIKKRASSPVVGIALLVVGAALLIGMKQLAVADSMQALMLTLGIIAVAVGLVLTAMCLGKAIWHYVYLPTGSRMKQRTLYLSATDYAQLIDALGTDKPNADKLRSIKPVVSSNSAVRIVYSTDKAMALLQAGRLDTGHFEAETAVAPLFGTEVAAIELLCK